VSTEVALLARLHGVPVVTVVLPGERSDAAHLLGYRISEALVAAWPERARSAATGIPDDIERRIEYVGGLSRVEISDMPTPAAGPRRVTVLSGVGGTTRRPGQLDSARREARGWAWTVLALPPLGTWASDPAPALRGSDVVITHAGQNAIAEVAAVRRPAIVLPEPRPFGEQQATARALVAGQWPATVLQVWPRTGWPRLLEETRSKDGGSWAGWCDGTAAQRFARIIERTVSRSHASRSAS
jgi:hypothetical protein